MPTVNAILTFSMFFLRKKKTPIYEQIEQFVAWKAINYPYASDNDRENLTKFVKETGISSIEYIRPDHIEFFRRFIFDACGSMYFSSQAEKSIKNFVRHHHARERLPQYDVHGNILKMKRGPAPHYNKIIEVRKLKAKNLSFRQIAKLLDCDVKTVFRWYMYDVDKLSTGKDLTVGR